MKNYSHNSAFRRVARALRLTRHDVVDICAFGGVEVSASKADGWRRGEKSYRKPDPRSHNPNELERRDKPISDSDWSAFWRGLDIWLHRSGD